MTKSCTLASYAVINDSASNKSTAFSRDEREQLGLRGLLPYAESSQKLTESSVTKTVRLSCYSSISLQVLTAEYRSKFVNPYYL